MDIGNIRDFKQSQLTKVEQRKEEEKLIKKGVYQTKMMIQNQNMETLDKEMKRSQDRTQLSRSEAEKTNTQQQTRKKTDVHTEMKKMLSVTPKNIAIKI